MAKKKEPASAEDTALVSAAKKVGAAAGKIASMAGAEASAPGPQAKKPKKGKLEKKNKTKVPRRIKKARKKAAEKTAAASRAQ